MRQLQADSADIPLLTTAVQEAHEALARMLRLLVKQRQADLSRRGVRWLCMHCHASRGCSCTRLALGGMPTALIIPCRRRNAPTPPSLRAPSPPPLPSPVPTLPACIGVPVLSPPPAWQQYQQLASPPPSQLLSALLPLAGALAGQNQALRRKIDGLELDLRCGAQPRD